MSIMVPEDEEDGAVRLRASMQRRYETDPIAAAQTLELAKRTGVGTSLLASQVQNVRQVLSDKKLDAATIVNKYPRTAEWLSDPINASAGGDSLDQMIKLEDSQRESSEYKMKYEGEKYLQPWNPTFRQRVINKIRGYASRVYAGGAKGYLGLTSDEELGAYNAAVSAVERSGGPADTVYTLGRENAVSRLPLSAASGAVNTIYGWKRYQEILANQEKRGEVANLLFDVGGALQGSPTEQKGARTILEDVTEAGANMAAMLPASALIGKATQMLKASSIASKVPVLKKLSVKQMVNTSMAALESANEAASAYDDLIAMGYKHEEAKARANKVFLTNMPLIMLSNNFGFLSDKGKIPSRLVKSFLLEGGQEGAQQMVSNYYTERPIFDGVLKSSVIGGIVGSGTAGVGHIRQSYAESKGQGLNPDSLMGLLSGQQQEHDASFMANLGELAAKSPVGTRSSEVMASHVASVVEGTTHEDMLIPAEAFATYFQSKNIDPLEMAEKLGVRNFQEAVDAGTNLVIPTERYASQVAGTEHHAELSKDVKFVESEMTPREYEAYNREAGKAQAEQMTEEAVAKTEKPEPAFDQLKEAIYKQLTKNAAYSTQRADIVSDLSARQIVNLAKMAKVDPVQWYNERYNVNVSRVTGEGTTVAKDPDGNIVPKEEVISNVQDRAEGREQVPEPAGRTPGSVAQAPGAETPGEGGGPPAMGTERFVTLPESKGYQTYQLRNAKVLNINGTDVATGPRPPYYSFHGNRANDGKLAVSNSPSNVAGSGIYLAQEHAVASAPAHKGQSGQVLSAYVDVYKLNPFDARVDRIYTPQELNALGLESDIPMTGLEALVRLNEQYGSGDALTAHLEGLGFGGVAYNYSSQQHPAWSVFDEGSVKRTMDATAWTPEEIARRESFDPAPLRDTYNQGSRGQFDIEIQRPIGRPAQVSIKLLQTANATTFIHEFSGHFGLELIGDLAQADNATPEIKAEYQRVLGYLGIESREQITTEHHEKFADSVEQYFLEGKPPSEELRSIFARVKEWFKLVYGQLRSLVELTPEVREVFDRMFAADAIVADSVDEVFESQPIFATAEEMGVTQAEFERWQRVQGVTQKAKDKLRARLIAEMKLQETSRWKELEAQAKEEATAQVDAEPLRIAARALRTGVTQDGTRVTLDTEDMKLRYGKKIPGQFAGMHRKNGGITAEEAADFFGFASAQELLDGIQTMPTRQDKISELTKETMAIREGDLMRDEKAMEEAALELLNGSERESAIASDLEAIRRMIQRDLIAGQKKAERGAAIEGEQQAALERAETGARGQGPMPTWQKLPSTEDLRDAASRILSKLQIKDIKPNRYLVAQRKASNEAYKAAKKKNWIEAYDAKTRELLNHYLYIESRKMEEAMGKMHTQLMKVSSGTTWAHIGQAGKEFQDQISQILALYDLADVPNYVLEQRTQDLAAFIESQKDELKMINADLSVLYHSSQQIKQNYRSLTFDQFAAVHDAVINIKQAALQDYRMMVEGESIALGKAKAEMIGYLTPEQLKFQLYESGEMVGSWEDFRRKVRGYDAFLTKFQWLIYNLDRGDLNGPWRKYLWKPVADAEVKFEALSEQFTKKMHELINARPPEERGNRNLKSIGVKIPGFNREWNYRQTISALLHMGTEENRNVLLGGYGLINADGMIAPELIEAFSRLSRSDLEFVQGVWDALEGMWPLIAEHEQHMTGVVPNKKQNVDFAVTMKDGTVVPMLGGYIPLKAAAGTVVSGRQQEGTLQQMLQSGNVMAATNRSHTKEVTGATYRVDLDFESTLIKHVDQVNRDLAYREVLIQTNNLLNSQSLHDAASQAVGVERWKLTKDWLKSAVTGSGVAVEDIHDQAAQWVLKRQNAMSRALIVGNLKSFVKQFTDPVKAMPILAKDLGAKGAIMAPIYYMGGLMRTRFDKKRMNEIREMSPSVMMHREDNFHRELMDLLQSKTLAGEKIDAVTLWAAGLLRFADATASFAIWDAAYQKHMDLTMDEDQAGAIAYADMAVGLSLQAGRTKDMSAAFRSKNAFTRAVTAFASDANTLYNIMSAGILGKNPLLYAGGASAVIVSAILASLIAGEMPDDEEARKAWLAKRATLALPDTLPGINVAASAAWEYFGEEKPVSQIDPRIPILDLVKKPLKTAADIKNDEYDKAVIDAFDFFGSYIGVPGTGQIVRTARYLEKVNEGEEQPEDALDVLRGVTLGAKPKK